MTFNFPDAMHLRRRQGTWRGVHRRFKAKLRIRILCMLPGICARRP